MVAMIVLAIGILGLAPLVTLSIEGNNISRDIIKASSLAKEKLEYYEALDTLPAVPYTETETGLDGGYDRTILIRDNATDSLIPPGCQQIDIVISWIDKAGMHRSTSYTSLLN
jgi:Tfp pilus assembly protein PilV